MLTLKNIKYIITFVCLIISSSSNAIENKLRIGIATGYAPYISLNENGNYEGFDIDFALALSKQTKYNVEFKDLGTMDTLMLSLEKGDIDCVIWGLSITADRAQKYTMLHYYGSITNKQPLVFWRKDTPPIGSLQDMANKTIAVESGSIQDKFANRYPNIQLKYFDKTIDMIMELKYKRSDAALIDPDILPIYKAKFSNLSVIDLDLPEEDIRKGIGIAILKQNNTLAQELTAGIEKLKADGTIHKLEEKWIKNVDNNL